MSDRYVSKIEKRLLKIINGHGLEISRFIDWLDKYYIVTPKTFSGLGKERNEN